MNPLSAEPNFRSLSMKDLLEARDLYHWHLMNKDNVVGTAIGLYLIRKHDPWPDKDSPKDGAPPADFKRPKDEEQRTFDNSEVRPYSWPCILVVVRTWEDPDSFRGKRSPEMVPPRLYLPDGRVVPVCVVRVDPGVPAPSTRVQQRFPDSYLGGGFPLVQEVQGALHEASVGCLVTDGHRTFALTNRHATGEPGSSVLARVRGGLVEVGRSTKLQRTRELFSKVFPQFAGHRTFLTVDVGLVDVTNANDWSSQPYGLPWPVGAMADLNELNLSLQLIDRPVMAFGAVSGHIDGHIKALFYRHKARAGFEYVSEFLIAPDDAARQTCPGDSGTVWHLVEDVTAASAKASKERGKADKILRPIAVEWGGQTLLDSVGQRFNFALATGLSTACELLDVDLVVGQNTGPQPYWGQTGHYSIATVAIGLVQAPTLKAFLQANVERISFHPDDLTPDQIRQKLSQGDFVELADVPDLVWKKVGADVRGGRDYARNSGPEHPNHYADIDAPGTNGQTLRDLTLSGIANMDVKVWQAWYAANAKDAKRSSDGLLPFRVWQLFDEMVRRLKAQDAPGFLCAAGVLSHYVGDACQPLHGSYHADGYKERGDAKHWPGKGVHSTYEDKMVDRSSKELLGAIAPAAQAFKEKGPTVTGGQQAAFATVTLMASVAKTLPPSSLIDAYIQLGGGASARVVDGLWKAFGPQTAQVMGAGARYLAVLWDAAFAVAGTPLPAGVGLIPERTLAGIYQNPSFVPSLTLANIGTVLQNGPAPAPVPRRVAAPAGRVRRTPARGTKTPRRRR
jgi:hypothetical protein